MFAGRAGKAETHSAGSVHHRQVGIVIVPPHDLELCPKLVEPARLWGLKPPPEEGGEKGSLSELRALVQALGPPLGNLPDLELGDRGELRLHPLPPVPLLIAVEPHPADQQDPE